MSQRFRVLAVDDDEHLRRAINSILSSRNYEVRSASSVEEAVASAIEYTPDIIITDLAMPNQDGFEFVRRSRTWLSVPILVLSVRSATEDKIRALDLGADDYLTKPFEAGELLARVRALLRRARPDQPDQPCISIGDITIDLVRRKVYRVNREISLTRTEFDILAFLARNGGRIVTPAVILERVWNGAGYEGDVHMLRVHISNLRKKIEPDPSIPRYIVTEPGIGYSISS